MHKDFVPDSPLNLRDWTQGILTNVDDIATRLHWSSVTAFKARVTRVNAMAQAVLDLQADLDAAAGQLQLALDEELSEIRQDINNLKATRGWTDGDGRTLDVLTGSTTLNRDTYRPVLSLEAHRGRIVISARKRGVDSLNVYVRRKGETTWRLLAAKRVRFPLEDQAPPATPGALEEREYQAIGVVGDDEFGQPSQIATAVFQP